MLCDKAAHLVRHPLGDVWLQLWARSRGRNATSGGLGSYSNSHPTCELGDVWLQLSGVALSLSEDDAGFVGLYVECHKAENGDECAGSRCYATKQPGTRRDSV